VEFISLQHECGGGLIRPIATVKTIHDRIAMIKIFFACRKRVDTTLQNGAETNSTNGLIKRRRRRVIKSFSYLTFSQKK